ncbi:MAG TPA: NAD(P)-binding domain-containing protein [Candidatus Nanoarchaeia archaeon]|nr:NAD(P)-binding domain-containing protein [Candidatus Nanoarchaeia archaeon]
MVELAVIGGGVMGSYSARELAPFVDRVLIYDKKPLTLGFDIPNIEIVGSPRDAVLNADFVLVCVPTENAPAAMYQFLPYCKDGAIIGGQTSRKAPEKKAFDTFMATKHPQTNLHYFSIHTMCNPSATNPASSILALVRGGAPDGIYQIARDFYSHLPGKISEFDSIEEHDRRVANTQVNTSRTMLTIASSFEEARCFPWLNGTYGGGVDAMKFALAMRAASFEPHVYKGIQFGNPEGKQIVEHSMEVEQELFRLVLGRKEQQYRDRVMDAIEKIFKHSPGPILSKETVAAFARGQTKPNSHYSLVNYLVAEAESGRDLFGDIKATTPMHTGLICLVDFLFNDPVLLAQSIRAPFVNSEVRIDDLVFHDQFQAWSTAIVFESGELYDHKHSKMRAGLQDNEVKNQVELSRQVVKVCQDALEQRLAA